MSDKETLLALRNGYNRMMTIIKSAKHRRPKCPASEDGKHTMIEYQDTGVKTCHDCDHEEPIYIKWS